LLKLHDPSEQDVTFDLLLDMYNNPQVVRKMHVKLKTTIPSDIDSIEERDERIYWKIVQGVDEWFDLNLVPKQTRHGNMMVAERDHNGEPLYFDAKAEHVQGLRNILNDIGANPIIRRVLFGKSDFDFDVHMARGGILLVNTAKGELVNLARVLGKIVLMNLQNASFRRPPMVSSFHHILVDEAPDYLYNAFREFPAQSRKYKVIITTLKQTIAQLADQFGEHYMTTLIGTMRNRMVYGDVPAFDAKYFSEMFGEKFKYQEGQTETSVSPMQENPVSRSGSSYQKVKEQAMTGGDIMFQDAFQCAVKIVSNNQPMPVVQIKANFVPKEEFQSAAVLVADESRGVWLEQRRLLLTNEGTNIETSNEIEVIQSIDQTEEIYSQDYEADRQHAFSLNAESIEKSIIDIGSQRPNNPIKYQAIVPEIPRDDSEEQNKIEQPSEKVVQFEQIPLVMEVEQVELLKREEKVEDSKENIIELQHELEPNSLSEETDTDFIDWEQALSKQLEEQSRKEKNSEEIPSVKKEYHPSAITEKEEAFAKSLASSLFEDFDEK
jgi:hypothetical protein